jgi:hypothetical protein
MTQIALKQIRVDQRAQPRTHLDTELVLEYADAMRSGDQFPPLVVFREGAAYWLADGFHRHPAALMAEMREYPCTVKDGGLREAILYSCGANAEHGRRRSIEDKQRAVKALLADAEWRKWSDREIARLCKVSAPFVSKLRPVDTVNVGSMNRTFTHPKTGRESVMDTSAIGISSRSQASETTRKNQGAEISAPSNSEHDIPAHHQALGLLALSIRDMRVTPAEIVGSCSDEQDRLDLQDACDGAAAVLKQVLLSLKINSAIAA